MNKVAGNFRREQWKMLLVTMFCYLFFYTGRHNFGWASKAMAADLHINYTMIGWISFSMLIGYAIGQLVNGNLADHFSPRLMIPLGGILSVAANFAISYANSFNMILVLWTLNGYFQSMAWAPGGRLISNWWGKEERGQAFGFYTMAAGCSSVVTYLLSIILVQQGTSWRFIFRVPVLFLLIALCVFYLFARSKPSDKGFLNIDENTARLAETSWKERYLAVLKNRRFLIASLAIGFQSMARYGLIFWVPTHYLGNNFKNNPNSIWVTILLPIGMAIGAVSFGAISDGLFKKNRPASIRMGMLVSAAIVLLISVTPADNFVLGMLLMFMAGFFVYGPQANFWPMSPEILGEKYIGTGIGIMNMSAYLFAAAGEPLIGKIIDVTHNTSAVFVVIAIICLLCAITISFVNYERKKQLVITDTVSAV